MVELSDKIKSYMILKSGKVRVKKWNIKDGHFLYNGGQYNIQQSARLHAKNFPFGTIPAYVHIEGISEPLDTKVVDIKSIKIDAKNLKELIKSKIIGEMFHSQALNTKDYILIGLVALSIVLAFININNSNNAAQAAKAVQEMLTAMVTGA